MGTTASPPDSIERLLPEYHFRAVDVETHRHVIMERVLERGSWEEIDWLFRAYGEDALREWVRRHGARALTRRSFALWRLVLGVYEWREPSWATGPKMGPW